MGYFNQYFNEELPTFSVVIEDDDNVCFAYLMEENKIISDVWLYNTISTHESVDWKNKDDLPFSNPAIFVKTNIPVFDATTAIHVRWGCFDEKVCAEVYLSSILLVKLERGAFPGWSSLVERDGPLALVYDG